MTDHDTHAVMRWILDDDQDPALTLPPGAIIAAEVRGLVLKGRDGRLHLTEDGEFHAQERA